MTEVARYWALANGEFVMATSGMPVEDIPSEWIEVPTGPEYADQLYDFEAGVWLEYSRLRSVIVEEQWRSTELPAIAEQLLMLEDGDPAALPGTIEEWRKHRIATRNWQEANPDYPDQDKRPQRPQGLHPQ